MFSPGFRGLPVKRFADCNTFFLFRKMNLDDARALSARAETR